MAFPRAEKLPRQRSASVTRLLSLLLIVCSLVSLLASVRYVNRNETAATRNAQELFASFTTSSGSSEAKRTKDGTTTKRKEAIPPLQHVVNTSSTSLEHSINVNATETFSTSVNTNATSSNTHHCLKLNSKEWLEGPRLNNYNDPYMTSDWIRRMTVGLPHVLSQPGHARHILGQTIAHEQSRFMNDTETAMDAKSTRLWAVRLLYLSVFYHQHSLAIPEAQARLEAAGNAHCQEELDKHSIGRFDYECPNAKFLLAELTNNGLGANVRGGTTSLLMAGLLSDRIVIFVNNATVGYEKMRTPWKLASCERGDYQCFFMSPSPCIPSIKDIEDAFELSYIQQKRLFKKSIRPHGYDDHKVWTFGHGTSLIPPDITRNELKKALHRHAKVFLSHVPKNDPRLPVLKKAADHLLDIDDPRPGYNYAAANVKINHALTFYAMRPNVHNSMKLEEVMKAITPSDLDPETTFGLPIRASDKCHGESECLSFHHYLRATTQRWQAYQNETGEAANPTVVFTTESVDMRDEQRAFVMNGTLEQQHEFPFDFRFVTNDQDVTPDTGALRWVEHKMTFTADENMLSVISSLKLQLYPRVTIGNCCSNFHTLINDFLTEGLGAASENTFQCMQEFEDPELRICCGWFRNCLQEKAEALAALRGNSTINVTTTS